MVSVDIILPHSNNINKSVAKLSFFLEYKMQRSLVYDRLCSFIVILGQALRKPLAPGISAHKACTRLSIQLHLKVTICLKDLGELTKPTLPSLVPVHMYFMNIKVL